MVWETVAAGYFKELAQEAQWKLEDLEQVKKSGKYNQYVTKKNIDEWIAGQKAELAELLKKAAEEN